MLKSFQSQKDIEASVEGDFRGIIIYVKFVPCFMHCVFSFYTELTND